MRKEHGFTLIELLIVLAILGILVGVVAMSVGGLTVTAKKRSMASEFQIVQGAMDCWLTQDVMVDGSPIATEDQTTPQKFDPAASSTEGWETYLKRATKYYYTWTDLAASGSYTLTVMDQSTVVSSTYQFDGTTWVTP